MGHPALPVAVDGATGGHEHRGVRGLLLQRLLPGLFPHGPRHGRARGAAGAHGPRAHRVARHGSHVLHQGPAGHQVRGQDEHPGRRGLHRARTGQRQRRHHLQHAVARKRLHLHRHPLRVPERTHRQSHGQRHRAHQRTAGHRRGRTVCGRIRHWRESVHHVPDEGHPVRRKKSPARSTLRPVPATTSATTATSPPSTGTSC